MTYVQQLFEQLKTQEGVLTDEQIQTNALISIFITEMVQNHGAAAAFMAAGASVEVIAKSGGTREELHAWLDRLLEALATYDTVARLGTPPAAP